MPMLTLAAVLLILVLGAAAPAGAQMPQQSGAVDLLTQSDVPIPGLETNRSLGRSLAAAGDFDGDGLADLILGSGGGNDSVGAAWVVLGRADRGPVDLASAAPRAVRIDGSGTPGSAGGDVAGVGDIDGDGFDDVTVGAATASPSGRDDAGSIYLVPGRPGEAGPIDLGAPSSVLVRIDGAAPDDRLESASPAGDFDGDGSDDLIVSSGSTDHNGTSSGSVYVLSGDALDGGVIDLAAPGDALLLRIDGAAEFDSLGGEEATAALGDFDGDGRDDIALGAGGAGNNDRLSSGSVYVVFGTDATGTLDVGTLGTAGLRIDGAVEDDGLNSVAPAPDLNADGLADLLAGAPGRGADGAAYLIPGGTPPGTLDLADPGDGVLTFAGSAGEAAGDSVASAGDVNGDGIGDLLVGAEDADANGRQQSGTVYVVFGSPSLPPVTELASLGEGGFRIDGPQENGFTAELAAGLGDFNGDERDDVATAGEFIDVGELGDAGRADVVYGFGPASLAYAGGVNGRAGLPIAPLAPAVERTGLATFSVAPALPAGLLLDAATGRISGTPQQAATATHTVTMTDLTGQVTTALPVRIAPAPPGPPGPPAPPGPPGPSAAEPALKRLTVRPRCAAFSRRTSVRFRLTRPATVTLAIRRRGDGRCPRRLRAGTAAAKGRRIVRVERTLADGARRLRLVGLLDGGRLRPGAYVVRASVPGRPVKQKRFWVKPRR